MKKTKNKARRAFNARIGVVATLLVGMSLVAIFSVAISALNPSSDANAVEELPVAETVEDTVDPNTYASTEVEDDIVSETTGTEAPTEPEPVSEPEPEPESESELEPKPKTVIDLTEQEFKDFCWLVAAEAGGEPFEGQVAVAAVIIHRIQSPGFPNTFYGVMTQKNQFSTVINGEIVSDWAKSFADVPEKTIKAVQMALTGEDPTEELLRNEAIRLGLDPEEFAEGGALFFYNPKGCTEKSLAKFQKAKVDITLKNHVFFKVWPTDG